MCCSRTCIKTLEYWLHITFLFHTFIADRTTCHCSNVDCDSNNMCVFNNGEGVCIAYYLDNTTLIQFCGAVLQMHVCRTNGKIYHGSTKIMCCFENLCNSQEALDDIYKTPMTSNDPHNTTLSTVSNISSEPSTVASTLDLSRATPNSSEQSSSSDVSIPVYAIVLSVVIPLIIIAIFGIAVITFLMYIRLYIKHKREQKPSTEFSQLY